jgi:hypothetical protein
MDEYAWYYSRSAGLPKFYPRKNKKMNLIKLITFSVFVFILISCKKDKDPETTEPRTFEQIDLSHIKQKESLMSGEVIQTSGVNGVGWKTGDVYVYRTRSGLFGKFKVGSIEPAVNYRLTITAVTYNQDGSVHHEMEKFLIRGTFGADLENMVEGASISDIDFQWARQSQVNTMFTPANGAAFIVYRLD